MIQSRIKYLKISFQDKNNTKLIDYQNFLRFKTSQTTKVLEFEETMVDRTTRNAYCLVIFPIILLVRLDL